MQLRVPFLRPPPACASASASFSMQNPSASVMYELRTYRHLHLSTSRPGSLVFSLSRRLNPTRPDNYNRVDIAELAVLHIIAYRPPSIIKQYS